jgi:hypothetical protein
MKIDVRPRKRNSPRPAEKSAPQYLQWLRGRDCCLVFMRGCEGRMEAAHVDYAGDKGMGTKASDRFAIPMCSKHHREQHTMGWDTFERAYGNFNALAVSVDYWSKWPGRHAWEAKNV